MQYILDNSTSPSSNKNDCIVVAVFANKKGKDSLGEAAKELDKKSKAKIVKVVFIFFINFES